MRRAVRDTMRAARSGMNRMVHVLPLACILAACADTARVDSSAEARPPVQLTASVDKAKATTGDLIRYEVTLDNDPGIQVDLPDVFSKIQGFKVVDIAHEGPVERDGRVFRSQVFKLRAFETGSYVLPALSLTYEDAAGKEQTTGTPQIFVEITSVLDDSAGQEDIADIKPPVQPPRDYRPLFLIGGGVLALAAIVGLAVFFVRRRRRMKEPPPPPPPPWEEALEALTRLENSDVLDTDDFRAYGFALSEVFRRYLERRFSFPAMENTTEEIMAAVRASGVPLGKPRDLAHKVLATTDLLKFAKGELSVEKAGELLDAARDFVEATTPRMASGDQGEASDTEGGVS